MPYTENARARIYYETRGEETAIPALFIQGFSAQMIGWRDGFLDKFVDAGIRAIMFDNRDVGLSQKFGGPGEFDGGYSLEDMAEDGFAVLDALGLKSAHVVGQSMGGMLAQLMALGRPERVRSLALFYTAPGTLHIKSRNQLNPPDPTEVYAYKPRDRAIDAVVEREQMCRSTAYPFNEAWIREWATKSFDRCYAPDGIARQAAAIGRLPASIEGLEGVQQSVAILHGRDDRLIDFAASIDLAQRLRNSELHLYPGLGHEVTEPLWDEFARIIGRTISAAER